ncbi:hypothetical protein CBR_g40749 [Chara braunii]|uniref:CUE domain-containing protein n=1 Tax=Chara braunii TaxID=69332 RepID=A0A388LUE1_CHABU|nr:hypothetical protein CBR_g40749 [Chara braunii]|eukprot:GBG85936.1 hypothetical protein CBR_g40749 [Chara braunii]
MDWRIPYAALREAFPQVESDVLKCAVSKYGNNVHQAAEYILNDVAPPDLSLSALREASSSRNANARARSRPSRSGANSYSSGSDSDGARASGGSDRGAGKGRRTGTAPANAAASGGVNVNGSRGSDKSSRRQSSTGNQLPESAVATVLAAAAAGNRQKRTDDEVNLAASVIGNDMQISSEIDSVVGGVVDGIGSSSNEDESVSEKSLEEAGAEEQDLDETYDGYFASIDIDPNYFVGLHNILAHAVMAAAAAAAAATAAAAAAAVAVASSASGEDQSSSSAVDVCEEETQREEEVCDNQPEDFCDEIVVGCDAGHEKGSDNRSKDASAKRGTSGAQSGPVIIDASQPKAASEIDGQSQSASASDGDAPISTQGLATGRTTASSSNAAPLVLPPSKETEIEELPDSSEETSERGDKTAEDGKLSESAANTGSDRYKALLNGETDGLVASCIRFAQTFAEAKGEGSGQNDEDKSSSDQTENGDCSSDSDKLRRPLRPITSHGRVDGGLVHESDDGGSVSLEAESRLAGNHTSMLSTEREVDDGSANASSKAQGTALDVDVKDDSMESSSSAVENGGVKSGADGGEDATCTDLPSSEGEAESQKASQEKEQGIKSAPEEAIESHEGNDTGGVQKSNKGDGEPVLVVQMEGQSRPSEPGEDDHSSPPLQGAQEEEEEEQEETSTAGGSSGAGAETEGKDALRSRLVEGDREWEGGKAEGSSAISESQLVPVNNGVQGALVTVIGIQDLGASSPEADWPEVNEETIASLEELVSEALSWKDLLRQKIAEVRALHAEAEATEAAAVNARTEAQKGGLTEWLQVVQLREKVDRSKEAYEQRAGDVHGEKAVLGTEARELRSRLIHVASEKALAMERLKELREFLISQGKNVDALQGEVAVLLEDVDTFKSRLETEGGGSSYGRVADAMSTPQGTTLQSYPLMSSLSASGSRTSYMPSSSSFLMNVREGCTSSSLGLCERAGDPSSGLCRMGPGNLSGSGFSNGFGSQLCQSFATDSRFQWSPQGRDVVLGSTPFPSASLNGSCYSGGADPRKHPQNPVGEVDSAVDVRTMQFALHESTGVARLHESGTRATQSILDMQVGSGNSSWTPGRPVHVPNVLDMCSAEDEHKSVEAFFEGEAAEQIEYEMRLALSRNEATRVVAESRGLSAEDQTVVKRTLCGVPEWGEEVVAANGAGTKSGLDDDGWQLLEMGGAVVSKGKADGLSENGGDAQLPNGTGPPQKTGMVSMDRTIVRQPAADAAVLL